MADKNKGRNNEMDNEINDEKYNEMDNEINNEKNNEMNKEKKKSGAGSIIIIIIAAAVIIFSLCKLIPILLDYKQADDTYRNLQDEAVLPTEDDELPDWAKVTIDFASLKAINPDVVGWIRFDDTDTIPIDYPILYSGDNETYLRRDLYGESHTAGSIFMEALNSPDFSDYYTIIYGHNMKNGSMFGSLKKYKRDDTIYDSNQYFTIYTEDYTYRYQIFAYGDVSVDGIVYTVGYMPDEEYQTLINTMLSKTMKDTGIVPTVDDRIVTLSTCSYDDDVRFVVHGVCIDYLEVK